MCWHGRLLPLLTLFNDSSRDRSEPPLSLCRKINQAIRRPTGSLATSCLLSIACSWRRWHFHDEARVQTVNRLLVLSEPLLQLLRLVEHYASVVREAPLLLVESLANVAVSGQVVAARADAHVRLASVPTPATLMVAPECLRCM